MFSQMAADVQMHMCWLCCHRFGCVKVTRPLGLYKNGCSPLLDEVSWRLSPAGNFCFWFQGLQDLKGVKELLDYLDLPDSQALADQWDLWAHLQTFHTLSRADGAPWSVFLSPVMHCTIALNSTTCEHFLFPCRAHLVPQGEMVARWGEVLISIRWAHAHVKCRLARGTLHTCSHTLIPPHFLC